MFLTDNNQPSFRQRPPSLPAAVHFRPIACNDLPFRVEPNRTRREREREGGGGGNTVDMAAHTHTHTLMCGRIYTFNLRATIIGS